MKIRTISYRRVRNLGNYQTETVEIQGEIDDKEDPDTAFRQIKAKVFSWLGFNQPQGAPPLSVGGHPVDEPETLCDGCACNDGLGNWRRWMRS